MKFESMVRQIDPSAQFQYLSSFKRSRIEMKAIETSIMCYEYLNNYRFDGQKIRCYYVQVCLKFCEFFPLLSGVQVSSEGRVPANDGKSNSRYMSCSKQLAPPQSAPGSRRYINGLSAPDARAYGAI